MRLVCTIPPASWSVSKFYNQNAEIKFSSRPLSKYVKSTKIPSVKNSKEKLILNCACFWSLKCPLICF